jgi:hypothetical protein
MILKPEIIHVLQREITICEAAMSQLREKTGQLESQYGWSTTTFLRLFNAGRAGDDQDLFRWYALAEALQDWQKTYDSLQEILGNAELVLA